MEAVGSLIATAVERANAVERLTHTEAARESERLRSALLDSVTHEFRTPLTSIKASVTTLRSGAKLSGEQQEDLLAVVEEESDRLNRVIGEAVEMAQLDAKEVRLDLVPHQIREAVEAALAESKHSFGRPSRGGPAAGTPASRSDGCGLDQESPSASIGERCQILGSPARLSLSVAK